MTDDFVLVSRVCEQLFLTADAFRRCVELGLFTVTGKGVNARIQAAEVESFYVTLLTREKALSEIGPDLRVLRAWSRAGFVRRIVLSRREFFWAEDIKALKEKLTKLVPLRAAITDYGVTLLQVSALIADGAMPVTSIGRFRYLDRDTLLKWSSINAGFSLSEAAKRLGISTDGVKHRERLGLLECSRTPGGHRRFSEAQIRAYVECYGMPRKFERLRVRKTT